MAEEGPEPAPGQAVGAEVGPEVQAVVAVEVGLQGVGVVPDDAQEGEDSPTSAPWPLARSASFVWKMCRSSIAEPPPATNPS